MVRLLSIAFCLLVAGCTATYPVVGSFDNHNEVFIGTVVSDLSVGQSEIAVAGKVTGLRCTGRSNTTYIPPSNFVLPTCAGQRGGVMMRCADGRVINGDWTATSCTTGYGRGADQSGNTFSFTFGLPENEAIAFVEKERKIASNRPDLPAYRPKETRREKGFATGTGFFVSSHGHLVTNFHVIEDAKQVFVVLKGTKVPASVLRVDRSTDVALLKVEATTKSLHVARTAEARRGDDVFTLGYPLITIQGQEQKASFGRINAVTGIKDDFRFLQTDVPIQPGNSGGPLLDTRGQVVGIVTATLDALVALRASGALPQNVNYAVKADYLIPILSGFDLQADVSARIKPMNELVSESEDAVVLVIAQ